MVERLWIILSQKHTEERLKLSIELACATISSCSEFRQQQKICDNDGHDYVLMARVAVSVHKECLAPGCADDWTGSDTIALTVLAVIGAAWRRFYGTTPIRPN